MNTAELPFPLPASLNRFGDSEQGRAWLAELPLLLHGASEEWQLELDEPFPDASASLTLPALLRDGSEAVLKIQFPHREAEQEAAALAAWNGDGAVRLLAQDPARHALLVERCRPGTPLSDLDQDAALDIVVELLPRLWQTTDRPFIPLADEAQHWAETLPGGRSSARSSTQPSARSTTSFRPRASACCSTRTSTPATCCAPGATRGWRSTRNPCPASVSSASHRSSAALSSATAVSASSVVSTD